MAKKKKKDDDDFEPDDFDEGPTEHDAPSDEEAAPAAEDEATAEFTGEAADADDVTEEASPEEAAGDDQETIAYSEPDAEAGEDGGGGEESGDEEFEPSRPRPKVTLLTLALCVLNVLAALGFIFLLVLDYNRRQAWSYAVFKHDLALMGLPLEEEDNPSASQVTFPRKKLDGEQLKKAFSQRGGMGSVDFDPATLNLGQPILPRHLTKEILADWFRGLGEPVATLEDEVRRLKKDLAGDLAKAAEETAAAAKTEDAKRQQLKSLLLPLAYFSSQIDAADKKIKDTPADKLDGLLKEAAQRRMLADILLPLNYLRPADPKDNLLDKIADIGKDPPERFTVPLERFLDLLIRRLDEAISSKYDGTLHYGPEWANEPRSTLDKRQAIAFLLFTVSQVKKSDGKLLPTEPAERLEAVVGLYEYAVAAQNLTWATLARYDRLLKAIRNERGGSLLNKDNQMQKVGGFISSYQEEVRRIQGLVEDIQKRQGILNDLQNQIAGHMEIIKDRTRLVQLATNNLIKARGESARLMEDLAKMQAQLFQAKVRLRDAQQQNLLLLRHIHYWENLIRRPLEKDQSPKR